MGIWYKDFYLTTPAGEKELRAALNDPINGAENLADVKIRHEEMQRVVAQDDNRCHITKDQIVFLNRVLNSL